MQFHTPTVFKPFAELTAGFIGRGQDLPNANLNTITDPQARAIFEAIATSAGFDPHQVIATKQVHGADIITIPTDGYGASADAIITNRPDYLLTIRMADCAAIMLYDPTHHALANIHAGWRGTEASIVPHTIARMAKAYGTNPQDIRAFVGPAISGADFEVHMDVAEKFDRKYWHPHPDPAKVYLDYTARIVDQLLESGVPSGHIEHDPRSTFSDDSLHSYRRDKDTYAHNVAFIGLNP